MFIFILITKSNKTSYIIISMPLLYNIIFFYNTVTIQSSVSMCVHWCIQCTFVQYNRGCDKACVTWSQDTLCLTLRTPVASVSGLSARVPDFPAGGQWLLCVFQHQLSTAIEQVICYSKLRYIHVRIHVMKIRSTLHVIM